MKKTALVLSGGGSRGAYQIGVWEALSELDVTIDMVSWDIRRLPQRGYGGAGRPGAFQKTVAADGDRYDIRH